MEKNCKIYSAAILALGITLCGIFAGYFYYLTKTKTNYVTVKGLAEMDVKADLGVWNLKYIVLGNDLFLAQSKMEKQQKIIISFLKEKGFSASEINVKRTETTDVMANPYRNDTTNSNRYILTQHIEISTTNVDLLDKAFNATGELIAKGIVLNNDYAPISYIFTKINEIKPRMLKLATQNAELAANEFAQSSNSKVGKIHKANQGIFSIQPRYKTSDSTEMNSIEKKIRVVSTIEYFLD